MVMLDPEPDDGTPYKADIDSFALDVSGLWRWRGGNGSDWRFGWDPRPPSDGFYFEGMASGGPNEVLVAPGVAGSDVEAILVRGDTWSMVCAVEPRSGAFLAGASIDEQVVITSVDASGRPLHSVSGTTLWDALQEPNK